MSFMFRDRKDEEFSYGKNPSFGCPRPRPRVVYERYYYYYEDEDEEERQNRNLENFYAAGLK